MAFYIMRNEKREGPAVVDPERTLALTVTISFLRQLLTQSGPIL